MQAAQSRYGTTSDGRAVTLFTLENSHGVRVTVIDLGATVTSVMVPDRSGKSVNVTLGYDSLAGWENNSTFFGCIVGRVANRIRGGRFDLDGKQYTLARNIGENHLHGGVKGFNKSVWSARLFKKGDAAGIRSSTPAGTATRATLAPSRPRRSTRSTRATSFPSSTGRPRTSRHP